MVYRGKDVAAWSRPRGAIPILPYISSWRVQGKILAFIYKLRGSVCHVGRKRDNLIAECTFHYTHLRVGRFADADVGAAVTGHSLPVKTFKAVVQKTEVFRYQAWFVP